LLLFMGGSLLLLDWTGARFTHAPV